MLDYKKTEDMERMKAEAVKRLKWPKIPGLNEAFAKGIKILYTGICRKSGLSRLFRNWHYWYRMYRKWNHTYLLILHNKRREQTFWLLFFMFFRQSYTLLTE